MFPIGWTIPWNFPRNSDTHWRTTLSARRNHCLRKIHQYQPDSSVWETNSIGEYETIGTGLLNLFWCWCRPHVWSCKQFIINSDAFKWMNHFLKLTFPLQHWNETISWRSAIGAWTWIAACVAATTRYDIFQTSRWRIKCWRRWSRRIETITDRGELEIIFGCLFECQLTYREIMLSKFCKCLRLRDMLLI